MSKKIRRAPVVLDAGEIKNLPMEDIKKILRGAEELLTYLEIWKQKEVKKIAARIKGVENSIIERINQLE